MAEVFLAYDLILGRDLALKVLREHYAKDAQFVERFRREAQSAAALNHPNVVQVYDQGRFEDGRYYIAMEHVLLNAAGEVKVADFGIALAASTSSTSGTNLVFGTARYMSPEQAMGKRVGPQSDLYSLGVVLYEMLTSAVPFEAEGPLATVMKHVIEPPLPPRKRNPLVPEGIDA